jgi:hypothetical protein
MSRARALRFGVSTLAAVALASACSHLPGMGQNTPATHSASSAAAGPTGSLNAGVPTAPGFPPDIPIYPKARLTAAASFASSGQTAWGMEWETADTAQAVDAYYLKQLNQGDWTLSITNQSAGAFAGKFARRSNSHDSGTLAINADTGVTTIALSFVTTS